MKCKIRIILCTLVTVLLFFTSCDIVKTRDSEAVSKETIQIETSAQPQSHIVYVTEWGTKYHREGFRYLSQSCIAVDLDKLDTEIYSPCSVCRPYEKE